MLSQNCLEKRLLTMDMLSNAFRALVKNPFKKKFNIIFMGNEKKLSKY